MIRKLIIERKRFSKLARFVGECHKISEITFRIRSDSKQMMIAEFQTLFHEFGHFLFWTFFKKDAFTEEREHAFLEELEVEVERLMKKHLFGGK